MSEPIKTSENKPKTPTANRNENVCFCDGTFQQY